MTILDKMEAALRFYESAWVNNSYGSADGDPGKRLLADKGQRARETLRKYEALKGRVVVVPVEPTRKMWAAMGDAVVRIGCSVHHDIMSENVYRAAIQASQMEE